MNLKYHNKKLFLNAQTSLKTNPWDAKTKLEEYLELYPKDYLVYSYYASVLIMLGLLKEAEEILKYGEMLIEKENTINLNNEKSGLEHGIFITKLKLYSYQGRYDELYELLAKNKEYISDRNLNAITFYSKNKNGLIKKDKSNIRTYLFRQIIDYNEDEFLEHIKKHRIDSNGSSSTFNESFPLEQALEEIKKYLLTDKRLYIDFFLDLYVFKYDSCGKKDGVTTNYFKVYCLHDTKDIITMYPALDCQNLPYNIDLNYLLLKDCKTKVKRKSQIDKFNQRYKK